MKDKLDNEEMEILKSVEKGDWKSVDNFESQKEKYREAAKNTLIKNKRINIRINERDLQQLKAKSAEEGLPYQSLITSILHKYINGKLKDSA